MKDKEQEIIKSLMYDLYKFDSLDENEKLLAKEQLEYKINGRKISKIERLKLMIDIKRNIVGKKKRKFYIHNDSDFFNRGYLKSCEIHSLLLDNGNIQLTNGLDLILTPSKPYFDDEDRIFNYSSSESYNGVGTWRISQDFKTLSFEHISDKRWSSDLYLYEVNDNSFEVFKKKINDIYKIFLQSNNKERNELLKKVQNLVD
jgi:hypothetical protein